ncbi:MAG: 50S ribosomal protein L3 [Deltaproteobacteria bacterium]|nr:50S ribosomal protein L3 [Deltaproteobacteria bacterium]
MTLGLIGRKIGMTQIFSEEGEAIPVTVIQAGPCTVIAKKTLEKHGYTALQVGFGRQKESRLILPLRGQFKKAGVEPCNILRELRVDDNAAFEIGQKITVELFSVGEKIAVTGRSKGRGFAGVVKRWGFRGGRETHGSMFHRAPGSIGSSAYPSRVFKGRKLPGHYGDANVTVRNVKVVDVRPEEALILVKGSIPGSRRGMVLLKKLNHS